MASAGESIPLSDRVDWLRLEHAGQANAHVVGVPCDAPLDLGDEHVWAAQVAVMRAAIRTLTDEPVDVVYSAEDYGQELARWFDATFSPVRRPPEPVRDGGPSRSRCCLAHAGSRTGPD